MNPAIFELLKDNQVVHDILSSKDSIGNLFLMEEALVLATSFIQNQKTKIIVKKNSYEAQQLYKRLTGLVDNVLLFVMEESLRVQAIASSPEDKDEMIYTLTKLVKNDQPCLIVCNVAALTRYLPDPAFFKENCLHVQVDQELNMDQLKKRLNRMGYTHLNYVDRPCTFAYRGGIVDIYSLEHEHPIRIEFFDTVVESIRFFDEETQRTIQNIQEIDFGPATDLLFTDEQIESIKSQVEEKLQKEIGRLSLVEDREMLQDHIEADMRSLENYEPENILYLYYPYTKGFSLLDYIDAQIIFSSVEEVHRFYKKLNEENISYIQERVQDHISLPKYMVFHDLDTLCREHSLLNFHEYYDDRNKISSSIYPLERATLPLVQQLQNLTSFEKVYFALEENPFKQVLMCMKENEISIDYERIEPEFYEGFNISKVAVVTSRELFVQAHHPKRYQKTFKEGTILENVMELEKNDYVVHEQYGIGQYLGIVTRENQGKTLDYLHVVYRGGDELFVPLSQFQLVRKYISKEGTGIKLSQLGTNTWQKTKEKVNQKVEEIAARLVELYALRNENIGFAYPKDDALQKEFEDAFEYEPTADQIKAVEEIKKEMEKPKPMDHLLCGDVGFGKTEVAMRCAFKAISSSKQVAFLCPTTILSMQHYQTIKNRFEYTGANIALVNRFVSSKEIQQIIKDLKKGTIDIVVGTHRLLNSDFQYKDLGLLVIDEEQRFGVEHKEKIKEMKNSIDVLSLSATPIPRTMQMSLIGVRTISQLNTPPAKRHPIQTYIMEKREGVIKEIIARELARGGQVFYLFNRIEQIYTTANHISHLFPDVKVAVAHGKMDKETIEETMLDFAQGKYQILVCTTIIETGLDIANANTIIIENADKFGLAQLYQIRGRVGRRDKIAYCYLMIQPNKELSETAQKRLKSIKEFTRLGSGYKIAMRDLTIRGAGDLLGPQQAGFIDQVGLDMYLELLGNAISRHKGEKVEETEEKRAVVHRGGHIPEKFTENDGDKLSIYQQVRKIHTYPELESYHQRIRDLFGKIPKEVEQIFEQRWLDLFVNLKGIDTLKEEDKQFVLIFDEEFSSTCDGIKLFETMNDLSKTIGLTLKKKKIYITIPKKKKNDLLIQTLETIKENFL